MLMPYTYERLPAMPEVLFFPGLDIEHEEEIHRTATHSLHNRNLRAAQRGGGDGV